jgi:glutathione synthase/RimK-type ligase-like ATP-grasp enzyme
LSAFAESISQESGAIVGLAPLLKQAFYGMDLSPLAQRWIERARTQRDTNALFDLSIALELQRKPEIALAIQSDALKQAQRFRVSSTETEIALKLLVIKAPGDLSANTPIECLLENTNIAIELLFVSAKLPLPEEVPEHDLLFVAIAESDENREILEALQQRLASWPRPYLNAPREILKMERDCACALLSPIPGVAMPETKRVDRETLNRLATGGIALRELLPSAEFPIIARPVDSHAGRGLIRAACAAELLPYLGEHAAAEFFLSQFIDYSSSDGLFRKYRVVLMRGTPYLCHMGISEHWMVHYPYKEMIAHPERREEEKQAMEEFDSAFARRHQRALAALAEKIGLEYFGLDCAESASGDLVIFEVASAMLVHAMDNAEIFPYKAAQMRVVFDAFRTMLVSSVASAPEATALA